jgi:hypothetical protein
VAFNLKDVPAWLLLVIDAALWVLFSVRFWIAAPPKYRWRIPVAVAIGGLLLGVQGAVQGRSQSTVLWMSAVVCLSLLVATIKKGDFFREYVRLQDKYGRDSAELRHFSWLFAFRILAAATALLTLSAVFVRGISI